MAARTETPLANGLRPIITDESTPSPVGEVPLVAVSIVPFWQMGQGAYAADGRLQGFIETLLPATPYVGSGVAASAKGLDKEDTQDICQSLGLAVPKSVCFEVRSHPPGRACRVSRPGDADCLTNDSQPDYKALCLRLGALLVVKPACSRAALDLALVETQEAFEVAFAEASRFGPVLVQEYVRGDEYAVCVLDQYPRPLPVYQILGGGLQNTAKNLTSTSHCVRPPIGEELATRLQQAARAVHNHLGCHGFSRLDLKVDREGRLVILALNTNPGLIPEVSIFPSACQASGLSYPQMIQHLLLTAFLPRWRNVPRVDAAAAAPFPEECRDLLPSRSQGWEFPVYQRVAKLTEGKPPVPRVALRHLC